MCAGLVVDALKAAVAAHGGAVDRVIFHSDRGSQYTSTVTGDYCAGHGIHRSMGRVGSCFDDAVAESFFSALERETVYALQTRRFADETEPCVHP